MTEPGFSLSGSGKCHTLLRVKAPIRSIRLPDPVWDRLRELARLQQLTMAELIKRLTDDALREWQPASKEAPGDHQ